MQIKISDFFQTSDNVKGKSTQIILAYILHNVSLFCDVCDEINPMRTTLLIYPALSLI